MLEKPDIDDGRIMALLRESFGVDARQIAFLPLGADASTAVYRAEGGGARWFVKLRAGAFDPASVLLPRYMYEQGIRQIIAPLPARYGGLTAPLANGTGGASGGGYTVAVYPYIEGRGGFDVPLSDAQWQVFGAALRAIHALRLPDDLRAVTPVETYSGEWRAQVRGLLAQAAVTEYADPIAAQMAVFLRARRGEVLDLVERAEALAAEMQAQPAQAVLCHTDLHAGNLLITPNGDLYIVDWDQPLLAPVERDLMFIGAGIGDMWNTPRESRLFYQGYGPAEPRRSALAYYRIERIVQDIAAYGEQILLSDAGGADRARGYRFFLSNFEPGGVIDLALAT